MSTVHVGDLIREMVTQYLTQGLAPSNKEISKFKDKTGEKCTIDDIKEFCNEVEHPEDTKENLIELFKFFDPNVNNF